MKNKPMSTKEMVFSAVKDLYESGVEATRSLITEKTGISQMVVDDRLRHLVDCGRIRRKARGVYSMPGEEHEQNQRTVGVSVRPDGYVVLHIGNAYDIEINKREADLLSSLLLGISQKDRLASIMDDARQLTLEV